MELSAADFAEESDRSSNFCILSISIKPKCQTEKYHTNDEPITNKSRAHWILLNNNTYFATYLRIFSQHWILLQFLLDRTRFKIIIVNIFWTLGEEATDIWCTLRIIITCPGRSMCVQKSAVQQKRVEKFIISIVNNIILHASRSQFRD